MLRTLPLLNELERRARALGFTWASLAAELSLDRTTLAHIRGHRGRLSLGTLHRIAVWFPTDAVIQRYVWEYLLHDVETQRERTARERLRAESATRLLDGVSDTCRDTLRGFVAGFAEYAVRGGGLLLTADDATALSHALSFLEAECQARGIHVLRHAANAVPPKSALPPLAATPLLLLDRVEFASAAMADVLRARVLYGKVTVVTTVAKEGPAETVVAREFRSLEHVLPAVRSGAGLRPPSRSHAS